MDRKEKNDINEMLVYLFNNILISEEKALSECRKDLSITEIHVIEAVFKCIRAGNNTALKIAETLRITAGSLSVALNTLERKGYIKRERQNDDKRIVKVIPLEKAIEINNIHTEYHKKFANDITESLSEAELTTLTAALSKIKDFFKE